LLYGTEDDLRYFTSAQVTDWTAVNRIKVGLLLSEDVAGYGLTNSKSYTIFNRTINAANDTKYRTVVMETVLIGNRG
jgi:type IV pilus assembly protein PilW